MNKAHRQSEARRLRNRALRARLRRALRTGTATASLIDRMVTKGVIHRNTGSRYKARLAA